MSNINNRVFGQNVDPKIIKRFDRLQRGRFNVNPNQEIKPDCTASCPTKVAIVPGINNIDCANII